MDPASELNGPADLAALLQPGSALCASWLYTPIGGMVAVTDATHLHLLEFPRIARLKAAFARLGPLSPGQTSLAVALQHELTAYFAGQIARFTIPLTLHAPPFTASVWRALQAVPYGATTTYTAFAASIGAPRAVRAVGSANASNPFAILVPCHRLIGADGGLTGYAGGLWRKEWLLAHERRGLRAPA